MKKNVSKKVKDTLLLAQIEERFIHHVGILKEKMKSNLKATHEGAEMNKESIERKIKVLDEKIDKLDYKLSTKIDIVDDKVDILTERVEGIEKTLKTPVRTK